MENPKILSVGLALFLWAAHVQAQELQTLPRLELAKRIHRESVTSIADEYVSLLKKRKVTSRSKGNIVEVRQIEERLKAFEDNAEFPPQAPANFVRRLSKAHDALESAYLRAIRDLTRENRDDLVAETEREFQQFIDEKTVSKYLAEVDYKSKHHRSSGFSTDGFIFGNEVIIDQKRFPKSIFSHPVANGNSSLVYLVDGSWHRLIGKVGIMRPPDVLKSSTIATPLTFEIFADGKRVWVSNPINTWETLERFDVQIHNSKEIKLEVRCPGVDHRAWAVWLDPKVSMRK